MDEQNRQDYEAVRQAVLDYVEGVYEVDPTRIERSVHPNLSKGGFFKQEGEATYSYTSMTYEQMKDLARTYNKDGKMPKDAPKEVVIFDMTDQIATAKLIAWWGIDYMHLAKYDGKWKIMNVLWQTHPQKDDRVANARDKQTTKV